MANDDKTARGPAPPAWHTLGADDAAQHLATDLQQGLSAAEAQARLTQHGANELRAGRRRSPWQMLAAQFTDFMILVLIVSAVIAGLVGDPQDAIAIIVIVVLNALVGFFQEYRAERAMAALVRMAAPHARVVRDAHVAEIAARELVPGDVVLLEAGNIVPADLRLAQAARFKVQESALTGESQAVEKQVQPVAAGEVPLGDRSNMAYKGTIVTYGRGHGVVVATGMSTELGRVAALLEGAGEQRTPLQQRLAHFGRRLALGVLAICAVVFVAGLLRGEPLVPMFLTAVSLAVAAIPEALPAVVTVALALGAAMMVSRSALVRRLPAVETLGSVTFICSDKTGTLTQNRMRVAAFEVGGTLVDAVPQAPQPAPWPMLLRALALSNDAHPSADGAVQGDPTEVALYVAAAEAGFDKVRLSADYPRELELPFDSERKLMSTLHADGDGFIAFTKGAPEAVLAHSAWAAGNEGDTALDAAAVHAASERMASEGLRVLAVACRRWKHLPESADAAIEHDLVLLGLVGLIDPPREEAAAAVAECMSAGIKPVMITGDHPVTARAIARQLGILGEADELIDGVELGRLSATELRERAAHARVYARVDPEQKIRIVEALQARGEIVAMTGDGVNDAPALKRAAIGVAMGKAGTDVAREASSLVLLDDNFATIVTAVREGRRIYDNIRKFIRYAMCGNAGEIVAIFFAPYFGLPLPLLPIQILWVNLVMDGLPGLALAVEPVEGDVMRRPPRPPDEPVFARGLWRQIVWVGLLLGLVCIAVQAWGYNSGHAHWQTMVFTVLVFSRLGLALTSRSERQSLFTLGLFSNLPLLGAVLLTVALQLAVIYLPPLNAVFHTVPLSANDLAVALALSSIVFVAVEIDKALLRSGIWHRRK